MLDSLSEDDLFKIIDWMQGENYIAVSLQFWIDELSRRRTARVLNRIAEAASEEAEHTARVVKLTADMAAENAKTATLNTEMRDMTRTTMKITIANLIVAVAALAAAAGALFR